ncbi:MAG: zf-HC2 domain-containing protein [candidate division Zixibacteria bacterium]|nr:zf-HC2 domain-containing protein [candidate division Zixibacteria bacterium]
MRCRKARSYLSAYCNDELTDRRRLAVNEHLSTCSSCRKEEAFQRSLRLAEKQLPRLAVSNDFNTRLLNRIAAERFAETRTKAYLPKRAPVLAWSKVVPAAAMTLVFLVMGVITFLPDKNGDPGYIAAGDAATSDNRYLTVQPVNNPNMTINLDKDWSLNAQLARAERINRISDRITPAGSFGLASNVTQVSSRSIRPLPYVDHYFQVRSVVRIYKSTETSSAEEDLKTY